MLSARESRHILQLARDETSSMRWLTDAESNSVAGTLESLRTQDLETVHARFDFDSEVFTSRAYMVASRANMINALNGSRRNGISHSTEITGGSQATGGQPRYVAGLNDSNRAAPIGVAITTAMDVESVHEPASESLRSQDARTEAITSRTGLVITSESDSQLPDFTIHTPEALGMLALELGASSRVGRLPELPELPEPPKLPTRRPLRFRSKKPISPPMTISHVRVQAPLKILILGISESGKSTLAKTMRAAHGSMSRAWLGEYRSLILNNAIQSLQWLLAMAEDESGTDELWELEGVGDRSTFCANVSFIRQLARDDDTSLLRISSLAHLGAAARYLWNHHYIREVFERSGTAELRQGVLPLYLPDCAE